MFEAIMRAVLQALGVRNQAIVIEVTNCHTRCITGRATTGEGHPLGYFAARRFRGVYQVHLKVRTQEGVKSALFDVPSVPFPRKGLRTLRWALEKEVVEA